MYFTQEDYKKIENWLLKNSVKDSEFQEALPLNGDETVVVTQNGHNRIVTINELTNTLVKLGVSDFINISDSFNAFGISLSEAITLIPTSVRKKGIVITFCNDKNNWELYQFKGVINQWNNVTLWSSPFISNFKTINGQSLIGEGNIIIGGGGGGDIDLSEYVTKVDADKNYQPKGDYALKSEIPTMPEVPTRVSELENDSNFVSPPNLKTVDGQSIVGDGDIDTGGLYVFNWDGETESGEFTQEEYNKLVKAKKRAIKFDTNIIFATAEKHREDGSMYFIGQFILGNYILIFDASFTPTSYAIHYEFKFIPQSTSDLENNSGFVNETQLAEKQDKLIEGDGIKIEGNTISCTHDKTLYKVVTELPEVGDEHKIYLIVSTEQEENNIYNEWAYINGTWEMLGTYKATVDLEPYALKSELPTKTSQLDNDSNFATVNQLPEPETYVLNFTIKDGTNTGEYDAEEYAKLRAAIEAGKLIIVGGTVTRVTADSQALAADYVVIRYGTPRISDDGSVTMSVYELKFSATEYTSKAVHKSIK